MTGEEANAKWIERDKEATDEERIGSGRTMGLAMHVENFIEGSNFVNDFKQQD